MASINNEIQDRAISHQIGILRRASGIRDRLLKIMEQAEQELTTRVTARATRGEFTQARAEFMLRDIRSVLESSTTQMYETVRTDLEDLAVWEAEFNRKMINGAAGVSLNFTMPTESQLRTLVTEEPFRGRLLKEWVENLSQTARDQISTQLRIGLTEGETIDQVVRRIRGTRANKFRDGIMEVSRRHAEAMVRTATNHSASAARKDLFTRNTDIVKKETYVATLDSRTTPVCQSLDGTVIEVGGRPRPPQHINCRSTTAPVTRSWREMGIDIDDAPPGTRASMDGQVPDKTTYSDWLSRQDKETVEDALGVTKAKLYRDGNMSIDKFVDDRGRTLTLAQLVDRDKQAFKRAGIDPDSI